MRRVVEARNDSGSSFNIYVDDYNRVYRIEEYVYVTLNGRKFAVLFSAVDFDTIGRTISVYSTIGTVDSIGRTYYKDDEDDLMILVSPFVSSLLPDINKYIGMSET